MKSMDIDPSVLADVEKRLESFVGAKNFGNDSLVAVDLLEHLVTIVRHKHRRIGSRIDFESFLNSEIDLSPQGITITAPMGPLEANAGTRPVQLQPALLRHLLLYHGQAYSVYDIIRSFVNSMWEHLQITDFKQTKTGVVRCFTNTRFAARTLRAYGFLNFTNKEAFKTWTLSLTGFLVAARIVETNDWIPKRHIAPSVDLHPEILATKDSLDDYEQFVGELGRLCGPQENIFETFRPTLEGAYRKLKVYWRKLEDENLSKSERKSIGAAAMNELARQEGIDKFYDEFSMAILNSELLESIRKNAEPPT